MAITKHNELFTAHGIDEERPNLFLAGDITEEYLPTVRIVTLPVMMASADDTTPTADPACSTQNCPDSSTLIGCGERPDDGGGTDTTTDTSTGTGTGTGGTGTGTGPGGM
jgi:hypothetical protein